jgi:hypothetical protein
LQASDVTSLAIDPGTCQVGGTTYVDLDAMGAGTVFRVTAPAANFDSGTAYSWTIATASGGITGFAVNKFVVDASGFQNDLAGGSFSVGQSGREVRLLFTPNPGPTAVQVISFTALRRSSGQVELRWRTGVEYDVLGFVVERATADGAWRGGERTATGASSRSRAAGERSGERGTIAEGGTGPAELVGGRTQSKTRRATGRRHGSRCGCGGRRQRRRGG